MTQANKNENKRNRKYNIGDIIENCAGDQFEIVDRQYKKGGPKKKKAWLKVTSIRTGYTRWRRVDKVQSKGGPREAKTKVAIATIVNLNDPKMNELPTKHVSLWFNMMKRCYQNETTQIDPPSVCKRWRNLYLFSQDLKRLAGYQEWLESEGEYHLDKDIKKKGNRVYSLEHCQFVPARINIMYTANMNGYTIKCTKTGARYPSMAACARQNKVAYCTVKKHVNKGVKVPRWERVVEIGSK